MFTFSQSGLPGAFALPHSSLRPHSLGLLGITVREAISQYVEYDLDLVGDPTESIDFNNVLGRQIVVNLGVNPGRPRTLVGIVIRVQRTGVNESGSQYRLTAASRSWLLTQRRQSQIFEQQSVLEIADSVLNAVGVNCLRLVDIGAYAPYICRVQYQEADYAFFGRNLEDEGLFWYDASTEENEAIQICDGIAGYAPIDEFACLPFMQTAGANLDSPGVLTFFDSFELRPAQFVVRDFHFEIASGALPEAQSEKGGSLTAGNIEYRLDHGKPLQLLTSHYPAGWSRQFDDVGSSPGMDGRPAVAELAGQLKRDAERRMSADVASAVRFTGTSNCQWMAVGRKFTMTNHPTFGDVECLLTRVEHSLRQPGYRAENDSTVRYENRFEAVPAVGSIYRPPRATPKPVVHGTHLAYVCNAHGEYQGDAAGSIWCDKYGRVRVLFHWTLPSLKSSAWVRITSPWAGETFGFFGVPRVGQEVVVGFEGGDPDRPLILGSVYNSKSPPPVELPQEAAVTGFVSRVMSKDESSANRGSGFQLNDLENEQSLNLYSQTDLIMEANNNFTIATAANYNLYSGLTIVDCVGGFRNIMANSVAEDALSPLMDLLHASYSLSVANGSLPSASVPLLPQGLRVQQTFGNEFHGCSTFSLVVDTFRHDYIMGSLERLIPWLASRPQLAPTLGGVGNLAKALGAYSSRLTFADGNDVGYITKNDIRRHGIGSYQATGIWPIPSANLLDTAWTIYSFVPYVAQMAVGVFPESSATISEVLCDLDRCVGNILAYDEQMLAMTAAFTAWNEEGELYGNIRVPSSPQYLLAMAARDEAIGISTACFSSNCIDGSVPKDMYSFAGGNQLHQSLGVYSIQGKNGITLQSKESNIILAAKAGVVITVPSSAFAVDAGNISCCFGATSNPLAIKGVNNQWSMDVDNDSLTLKYGNSKIVLSNDRIEINANQIILQDSSKGSQVNINNEQIQLFGANLKLIATNTIEQQSQKVNTIV